MASEGTPSFVQRDKVVVVKEEAGETKETATGESQQHEEEEEDVCPVCIESLQKDSNKFFSIMIIIFSLFFFQVFNVYLFYYSVFSLRLLASRFFFSVFFYRCYISAAWNFCSY